MTQEAVRRQGEPDARFAAEVRVRSGRPLVQAIAIDLYRTIANGDLRPGDAVTKKGLATLYGVSVGTVTTSLSLLPDNLMKVRHTRGSVVQDANTSPEDVENFISDLDRLGTGKMLVRNGLARQQSGDLRLALKIVSQMGDSAFEPESRVIPEQLVARFDVRPTTVKGALNILTSMGLLERKHAKGTFVPATPPDDDALEEASDMLKSALTKKTDKKKYQVARDLITELVQNEGQMPDNFPTTRQQIAEQYNVSVDTAQDALRLLKNVLWTRPRWGVTIRPNIPPIYLKYLAKVLNSDNPKLIKEVPGFGQIEKVGINFKEKNGRWKENAKRENEFDQEITTALEPPTDEIARLLQIDETQTVNTIRRVRFLHGTPYDETVLHVPVGALSELEPETEAPLDLSTITEHTGRQIAVEVPSQNDITRFGVPPNESILRYTDVMCLGEGKPFAVRVQSIPSSRGIILFDGERPKQVTK